MASVCELTATEPDADSSTRAATVTNPLRRNLLCSVSDGTSFSVMQGIGETYLPAFVLACGMGEIAAGLITTIPLLAGALLQLIAPRGVRLFRSHQRWIVFCSFLQALSFLPLAIGALLGWMPLVVVFLLAGCYFGSGQATAAAWNLWMEHLVPAAIRARFFARRTRFTQFGLLAGFIAGGAILQASHGLNNPLWIFAILFFVAFLCRAISATYLSLQTEPPELQGDVPLISWRIVLSRVLRGGEGRLLAYLWLMQGAAQIASPYFNPFMLEQLHFSYAMYVFLLAVPFLVKALTLPLWGRVAKRYGARRLLVIGGVMVLPLAISWVVSQHPVFLFFVQILSGSGWSAYELAMFLLFFDNIRPAERTAVLTVFNVGYAAATVGGSLVGGAILFVFGRNVSAYMAIFALSSLARVATLPWLARVPAKEDFDAVTAGETTAEVAIYSVVPLASRPQPSVLLSVEAERERAA